MSRPLLLTVTSIVVGATLAGCGGPEEQQPRVATAGETPSAAATTTVAAPTSQVAAYLESARAYARCMRAEGFNVSDPDEKGRITTLGEPKGGTDLRAGREKCAKLLQPMPVELRERPARTQQQIAAARAYAKCMRANGAPDFPDPDANGEFPDADPGSGTLPWKQGTAGARKALQTCASIVGDSGDTSEGVG